MFDDGDGFYNEEISQREGSSRTESESRTVYKVEDDLRT